MFVPKLQVSYLLESLDMIVQRINPVLAPWVLGSGVEGLGFRGVWVFDVER